jgi:hypothetical protein
LPEGLEPGTPFSLNIVAVAMYLRFVHAVSVSAQPGSRMECPRRVCRIA